VRAFVGGGEVMVRSMPALSWRNYVGLGLRGPEVVARRGRDVGFGNIKPQRTAARKKGNK